MVRIGASFLLVLFLNTGLFAQDTTYFCDFGDEWFIFDKDAFLDIKPERIERLILHKDTTKLSFVSETFQFPAIEIKFTNEEGPVFKSNYCTFKSIDYNDNRVIDSIICKITITGASFPGGTKALIKYISENYQKPSTTTKKGRIFVHFVVEIDGHLSEIDVLKGLDPEADKAAMELVQNMPPWKPYLNYIFPVRGRMIIPINVE